MPAANVISTLLSSPTGVEPVAGVHVAVSTATQAPSIRGQQSAGNQVVPLSFEYRNAALFAMPSTGEGFGLVYLEAMREGLPCVALAGGAASEIVLHRETGWLVDDRRGSELPDAIAALLSSPELREQYGACGRSRFERDFDFVAFRDRLGRILQRALPHAGV